MQDNDFQSSPFVSLSPKANLSFPHSSLFIFAPKPPLLTVSSFVKPPWQEGPEQQSWCREALFRSKPPKTNELLKMQSKLPSSKTEFKKSLLISDNACKLSAWYAQAQQLQMRLLRSSCYL